MYQIKYNKEQICVLKYAEQISEDNFLCSGIPDKNGD